MQNAQTLSEELRGVIVSRLNRARPQQILAVAASLCAQDERSSEATPVVTGLRERFEVSGDVVTDHKTGLMWTRTNVGGKRFEWSAAKKAAAASEVGGYTDWRLPTIQELLSIVDYERHSPSINSAFECESAWYWTSTPYASSPSDCAWVVYFDGGNSYWNGQNNEGFVWAVRSSQLVGTLG